VIPCATCDARGEILGYPCRRCRGTGQRPDPTPLSPDELAGLAWIYEPTAGELEHAETVRRLIATVRAAWQERDGSTFLAADSAKALSDAWQERDRLRSALNHLRRKIDGYDSTFDFADAIAEGKEP
jgi:hypothetical protein